MLMWHGGQQQFLRQFALGIPTLYEYRGRNSFRGERMIPGGSGTERHGGGAYDYRRGLHCSGDTQAAYCRPVLSSGSLGARLRSGQTFTPGLVGRHGVRRRQKPFERVSKQSLSTDRAADYSLYSRADSCRCCCAVHITPSVSTVITRRDAPVGTRRMSDSGLSDVQWQPNIRQS